MLIGGSVDVVRLGFRELRQEFMVWRGLNVVHATPSLLKARYSRHKIAKRDTGKISSPRFSVEYFFGDNSTEALEKFLVFPWTYHY